MGGASGELKLPTGDEFLRPDGRRWTVVFENGGWIDWSESTGAIYHAKVSIQTYWACRDLGQKTAPFGDHHFILMMLDECDLPPNYLDRDDNASNDIEVQICKGKYFISLMAG